MNVKKATILSAFFCTFMQMLIFRQSCAILYFTWSKVFCMNVKTLLPTNVFARTDPSKKRVVKSHSRIVAFTAITVIVFANSSCSTKEIVDSSKQQSRPMETERPHWVASGGYKFRVNPDDHKDGDDSLELYIQDDEDQHVANVEGKLHVTKPDGKEQVAKLVDAYNSYTAPVSLDQRGHYQVFVQVKIKDVPVSTHLSFEIVDN